MLRQRIITSIIMMIVVAAALVYLPATAFSAFIALILLTGAWEFTALLKLPRLPQLGYLLVFAVLLFMIVSGHAPPMRLVIGASVLWWCIALVLIVTFPKGKQLWQGVPVLLLMGLLVLLPVMSALMAIRSLPGYIYYVLVFIALVAAADIGAYFSGRAFGNFKLAPLVSPNKTWEGFVGGLICSVVVAMVALGQLPRLHDIAPIKLLVAITGCAVLAIFSVVGDLFESMLKRHCDAKDSSRLLPGHGGVLDRLDSITAALPVYVLILYSLEVL